MGKIHGEEKNHLDVCVRRQKAAQGEGVREGRRKDNLNRGLNVHTFALQSRDLSNSANIANKTTNCV